MLVCFCNLLVHRVLRKLVKSQRIFAIFRTEEELARKNGLYFAFLKIGLSLIWIFLLQIVRWFAWCYSDFCTLLSDILFRKKRTRPMR